jgi:16S rRNA (guanine966-N2)-methyltransferase
MARDRARSGGTLRIIGGCWRGRKLAFPSIDGLRPTPDRVRETLFNWLAGPVIGAYCLDLYAGSGALGLEALSRGAAHCDFIDSSAIAATALRNHLASLTVTTASVQQTAALSYLEQAAVVPRDIVFLDPPFGADLLTPSAALLEQRGWLREEAHIYIESGHRDAPATLPPNWELHRDKRAGDVHYRLFVRRRQFS